MSDQVMHGTDSAGRPITAVCWLAIGLVLTALAGTATHVYAALGPLGDHASYSYSRLSFVLQSCVLAGSVVLLILLSIRNRRTWGSVEDQSVPPSPLAVTSLVAAGLSLMCLVFEPGSRASGMWNMAWAIAPHLSTVIGVGALAHLTLSPRRWKGLAIAGTATLLSAAQSCLVSLFFWFWTGTTLGR